MRLTVLFRRDSAPGRGMALGAVLLYLVVFALQVSPELHRRVHHDSGEPDHQCAVMLVSGGQLALGTPGPRVVRPATPIALARFKVVPVLSLRDALLPAGRAPPARA